MRPRARLLPSRPGPRSRMLVPLAVLWVTVGWAILQAPDPDGSYRLPVEYLPTWVRVASWWLPAAAALIAAWWPRERPRWGYMALAAPAFLRASSYIGVLPWHPEVARDAVVWAAICWILLAAAEGTAARPGEHVAPEPEG